MKTIYRHPIDFDLERLPGVDGTLVGNTPETVRVGARTRTAPLTGLQRNSDQIMAVSNKEMSEQTYTRGALAVLSSREGSDKEDDPITARDKSNET